MTAALAAAGDVHHGNGTQEVFWSDGSVLFFDVHQHPWYPGTGSPAEQGDGKASGLIVNNPFSAGSGRTEILRAFRERLVPATARFKPELVLISAGFDSRAGDPLGQFTLTDQDFSELTDLLLAIASMLAADWYRCSKAGMRSTDSPEPSVPISFDWQPDRPRISRSAQAASCNTSAL